MENIQQKNKWYDRLDQIFAALIFALIAVSDIFDYNIGSLIIVGGISLMLFVLPYKKAVSFLFFILPFTCGISGYTVLLSYIILSIKSKHINFWQLVPPLIIICLEVAHIGFLGKNVNLITSASFLSFVALFFFLLFDSDAQVDRRLCVKMFIYGTIATLLIIYISIIVHNGIEVLLNPALRGSIGMGVRGDVANLDEFKGHLVLNANSIAYFSITTFSLLLLGNKRLDIPSSVYLCLTILSILAGVFSFSRTWVLVFALISAINLIASKSKIQSVVTISATIFLVCLFFPSVVRSVSDIFMGRFEDVETAGGRTTIFAVYNEFWLSKISYIFFGAGAMTNKYILNYAYSMHCGLQQIYVSSGVVGILLFLFVIRKYSQKYIAKKTPFIYYLPFWACFIFDQSIQFWDPYYLIFPFLAVSYVLRREFVERPNQVKLHQ